MGFDYRPGLQAQAGIRVTASDPNDSQTPTKSVEMPVFATMAVDASGNPVSGGGSGGLSAADLRATSATLTTVPQSTASAQADAADAATKGRMFYNTGGATAYLLYGTGTASATNCTVPVASGTVYREDTYAGAVQVVWAAAGSGALLITRLN